MIDKAVILVAGVGKRLKPLTDKVPKCMTEVNAKPILVNALEVLERNGFKESVIVAGHLSDYITEKIGDSLGNMKITYIISKDYETTNSMHGVWLAKEHIKQGALLIEGDCFFRDDIIKDVVESDENKSCWILDRFTPEMDGSMSIANPDGIIEEIKIIREKLGEYKPNFFKSCGIVKINPDFGEKFAEWLDQEVEAGNTNIYYDLVLAKNIKNFPVHVLDVTGKKWFEIDDHNDLKKAELLFRE